MRESGEYSAAENTTNYKAIHCEKIPELFLDKLVAKKHFSKFGKINRFILRPKRLSCTVEYENEEDAKSSVLEAGNFNGIEFIVNYAAHEVAHVQNTEEWVDPEVQAELEAMGSGPNYSNINRTNKTMALSRSTTLNKPITISTIKPIKSSQSNEATGFDDDMPQIDCSELEAILKKPALTHEDKYRVLEARDKLIRLANVRQTDIKKAVATRGTCPDMCPEKERLMRDFQRQVSSFEWADEDDDPKSTISHRKAIKEYSRSSADQEFPLAHELRSESVLQMTMLYLMHRIMDLCEDPHTSLGDWFHFVWDRTRSIRKDITQQELCSLEAVELVEQCARFHIHCAARLVAEDAVVFDKKINAENLTKCLQTLKYMYHDLRLKGIQCPREAEFRSYVIMLNLADSNFLWELRQLPVHIQKAEEIKNSIAFCSALQTDNYVRFFAMIKSDQISYLSACILLGYFNKLRLRAMEVIIKSHKSHKAKVFLPISYLQRILAFEDENATISFLHYLGWQCKKEEEGVFLQRISKPDVEHVMDRALKLVESKRLVSVGECISGHPLNSAELFENHQPHSSFDANGFLKSEAWTAEDQLKGDFIKNSTTFHLSNPKITEDVLKTAALKSSTDGKLFKIPFSTPPISPKQHRQQQHKSIFSNCVAQSNQSIPPTLGLQLESNNGCGNFQRSSSIDSSKFVFKVSPEKVVVAHKSIFDQPKPTEKVFGSLTKDTKEAYKTHNIFQHFKTEDNSLPSRPLEEFTATNFVTHKTEEQLKFEEMERHKQELEKVQILQQKKLEEERQKLELKMKVVEERRNRQLKEKEEERKREQERKQLELIKEVIEQASEKHQEAIINETVEDLVKEVASEELQKYIDLNKTALQELNFLFEELVFNITEEVACEEYAVICCDQLLLKKYFFRWLKYSHREKEQRKLLDNTPLWVTTDSRAQCTEKVSHPSQKQNMEMIKRYRLGMSCDFKQLLWSDYYWPHDRLDLFALVGQSLLIQTPALGPSGVLPSIKYFKLLISLPNDDEELPGFETFCNRWLMKHIQGAQTETGPFVHGIQHNLALCVRKLSGIEALNEQGDPSKEEANHNDGIIFFISGINLRSSSRKRLQHLLQIAKNYKHVPLAIMAYNCEDYDKFSLEQHLELQRFVEEGLIVNYKCFGCQLTCREFRFRHLFAKAINFITYDSYKTNNNDVEALAEQKLLTFLDSCLGEEIWRRWLDSSKKNPIFYKICSMPEHVIGVFNKAVEHLEHITQEDLIEMPEFPSELKEFVPEPPNNSDIPLGLEYFPDNWKDSQRLTVIKEVLERIRLPTRKTKFRKDINAVDVQVWLLSYTSECLPEEDDYYIIETSHRAIGELYNQLNYMNVQKIDFESLQMLNFLQILKPIAHARVNSVLKKLKKEQLSSPVIYLRNDLENYQILPWWLNYQALSQVTVDQISVPEENAPVKNNERCEISMNEVNAIIETAEKVTQKLEENSQASKKQKKNSHYSNNTTNIERYLDETCYQFELTKKTLELDKSYVQKITQDVDESIEEVVTQTLSPPKGRKRKISENRDDMKAVIDKAMDLIKQMESLEEKKKRLRTSSSLRGGFAQLHQ
uniref:SAC3/GANP/THP3 conserved domain-containing protein n=1 Tax=Glossina austeni TaxID=7395 RepID=A0A1A9UZJ9_GLOAU